MSEVYEAIKKEAAKKPAKAFVAASIIETAYGKLSLYLNDTTIDTLSANAIRTAAVLPFGYYQAVRINNRDANDADARKIRLGVAELRAAGVPVINTGDGQGYYIASLDSYEDYEDMIANRAQLVSRIKKLRAVVSGLDRAIAISRQELATTLWEVE